MSNLDFVKKLYNGKNCYSDHMNGSELETLHIQSNVEGILAELVKQHRIVFLTGNPGDGKTFIIKAIDSIIHEENAYVVTDLNNVEDYKAVAKQVIECFENQQAAVLAVNEYPFIQLCKEIRDVSPTVYKEMMTIKRNAIYYGIPGPETALHRIAVIDLGNRSLLSKDRNLAEELIVKMKEVLEVDSNKSSTLEYNLRAMSHQNIQSQIISLFDLTSFGCEHFAVRDIIGAFAYIFTACESEEKQGEPYYDVMFDGGNSLLDAIRQFDPVYLSNPSLDEQLWNGEITHGWLISVPEKWPNDSSFDDDVDSAVECFKSIKRRYYFENINGQRLSNLQPQEIESSIDIFTNFESQKRKIKERIIKSINKLFLQSSEDKKALRIWTTHRYDMSKDASTAISSSFIDSNELDIMMPNTAEWLRGMEYIPNHIILKPSRADEPRLVLDIDFLRTLDAIEAGYPVSLLAPQYEQAASMFLQKLADNRFASENEDGEIIIASRAKSYQKSVYIRDGKQYAFEEDE